MKRNARALAMSLLLATAWAISPFVGAAEEAALPPPPDHGPPYDRGEEGENDIWLEAEGGPTDDAIVYVQNIGRYWRHDSCYGKALLGTERKTLPPCGYCFAKWVFRVKREGRYVVRVANNWNCVPFWWAIDPKGDEDYRHCTRDKLKYGKAKWWTYDVQWASIGLVDLTPGEHSLTVKVNELRQDGIKRYTMFMDAIALRLLDSE